MKEEYYYTDYPTEPIGGGNPYYKCCSCGASDPQINGKLEGHFYNCEWVKNKRKELGESIINVGEKINLGMNDAYFKFISPTEIRITMANGGYVKIVTESELEVFCKPE